MKPRQTVSVEIVLDIACVWSYLGFTRFTRAVSQFRDGGGTVEVAFHPFQIDPRASFEGEPLVEVLTRNFGSVAVLEQSNSKEFASDDGAELHIDRTVHTNTLRAHGLIATATEQGLGEQMVARLFKAYYVDGLNVGDLDTLATLAKEVGVEHTDGDTDGVQARVDEVRRSGVQAVPVFIVNGEPAISGAPSTDRFFRALDEAAVGVR